MIEAIRYKRQIEDVDGAYIKPGQEGRHRKNDYENNSQEQYQEDSATHRHGSPSTGPRCHAQGYASGVDSDLEDDDIVRNEAKAIRDRKRRRKAEEKKEREETEKLRAQQEEESQERGKGQYIKVMPKLEVLDKY